MSEVVVSFNELENNYEKISRECKASGKPIFITLNGKKDTVIMSQQVYDELIDKQETSKRLTLAREDRLKGRKGATLEETQRLMHSAIEKGIEDSGR